MPYLEIYPIENSADKISKQLDAILEAKPTMYAKTKERYKQLAYSLLQSVEKISNILEEETLIPSSNYNSNEFDELSGSSVEDDSSAIDLSRALQSVQKQVSSYAEFSAESKPIKGEHPRLRKMSNKDIISHFAKVLEEASTYNFQCEEASQCARILHTWFISRFVPAVRNPKFRYSIKQIPSWISYIIILYGKYHSLGQVDVFENLIYKWCDDISSNNNNVYAVPYEVHDLMKSVKPDYYTMNCVIINDILMDNILYKLTSPYLTESEVFLDNSSVPSIVKSNNPSLVPEIRTRIAKRDILIEKYNLTCA